MKEPQKYRIMFGGGLRQTREWTEWNRQKNDAKKKPKRGTLGRRIAIDPETHSYSWKEIAWVSGSERRILFCCCQSASGESFAGCGAVGIRNSRGGVVTVVVESRFE